MHLPVPKAISMKNKIIETDGCGNDRKCGYANTKIFFIELYFHMCWGTHSLLVLIAFYKYYNQYNIFFRKILWLNHKIC